jgi:hypothetical protein
LYPHPDFTLIFGVGTGIGLTLSLVVGGVVLRLVRFFVPTPDFALILTLGTGIGLGLSFVGGVVLRLVRFFYCT